MIFSFLSILPSSASFFKTATETPPAGSVNIPSVLASNSMASSISLLFDSSASPLYCCMHQQLVHIHEVVQLLHALTIHHLTMKHFAILQIPYRLHLALHHYQQEL